MKFESNSASEIPSEAFDKLSGYFFRDRGGGISLENICALRDLGDNSLKL